MSCHGWYIPAISAIFLRSVIEYGLPFLHFCCVPVLFADSGKVVQLYRGAEGSIRSVACHTAEPIVAACGLDRFVRIYDIESRQLLQKVCLFLKARSQHTNWTELNTHARAHACTVHVRLTALFPGLPGWAGTRKVKPIRILLKLETVSGSGISWDICKSAPRCRQITTLEPTTEFLQPGNPPRKNMCVLTIHCLSFCLSICLSSCMSICWRACLGTSRNAAL